MKERLSTIHVRVITVCTGNICRSPMAQAILQSAVDGGELAGRVVVDSAGTHGYHIGEPADHRTTAVLAEAGYPFEHRARLVRPEWLAQRDLVLAMDSGHLRDLRAMAADHGIPATHIRLIRDFDPQGRGDVPDPYYDTVAQFRDVRQMLERTMPTLLDHLRSITPGATNTR